MLIANEMANAIKNSGINACTDASSAMQKFWNAVCTYVSNNLEAKYSWIGVNPTSGAPDPITILNCKCVANGSIQPCKLNEINSALLSTSSQMNMSAATWLIVPNQKKSPGFILTPGLIIPTISLSASNINEHNSALQFMCNQIITGIKKATPILTGTHGVFTGTANFISIV
jgi:hypothetical protein